MHSVSNNENQQRARTRPTDIELAWLRRGLNQPGGKLPLFDEWGQRIDDRTVRACLERGWAEPWFNNPLKPDWVICKLTDIGRKLVQATAPANKG